MSQVVLIALLKLFGLTLMADPPPVPVRRRAAAGGHP